MFTFVMQSSVLIANYYEFITNHHKLLESKFSNTHTHTKKENILCAFSLPPLLHFMVFYSL